MQKTLKKNIPYYLFTAVFLLLDLFSKWLVKNHLDAPIELIPGILKIDLTYNPNIAFSIPIPGSLMTIVTPLIIIAIIFLIARCCNLKHRITKIALTLIIAGGLGNYINRLWTGSVIDFIDFSFWPSFNLADLYLTVGVFLLIAFYGRITINHGTKPTDQ